MKKIGLSSKSLTFIRSVFFFTSTKWNRGCFNYYWGDKLICNTHLEGKSATYFDSIPSNQKKRYCKNYLNIPVIWFGFITFLTHWVVNNSKTQHWAFSTFYLWTLYLWSVPWSMHRFLVSYLSTKFEHDHDYGLGVWGTRFSKFRHMWLWPTFWPLTPFLTPFGLITFSWWHCTCFANLTTDICSHKQRMHKFPWSGTLSPRKSLWYAFLLTLTHSDT